MREWERCRRGGRVREWEVLRGWERRKASWGGSREVPARRPSASVREQKNARERKKGTHRRCRSRRRIPVVPPVASSPRSRRRSTLRFRSAIRSSSVAALGTVRRRSSRATRVGSCWRVVAVRRLVVRSAGRGVPGVGRGGSGRVVRSAGGGVPSVGRGRGVGGGARRGVPGGCERKETFISDGSARGSTKKRTRSTIVWCVRRSPARSVPSARRRLAGPRRRRPPSRVLRRRRPASRVLTRRGGSSAAVAGIGEGSSRGAEGRGVGRGGDARVLAVEARSMTSGTAVGRGAAVRGVLRTFEKGDEGAVGPASSGIRKGGTNEEEAEGTHFCSLRKSRLMVMTLLFVWSSTRAVAPVTSLMTPA